MRITKRGLQFVALLPIWQKILLSLLWPIAIFILYYWIIFIPYQQEIIWLQTETTQKLTRIHQYQNILNTASSLDLLKIEQADYDLSQETSDTELQYLLATHKLIPELWENEHDTLYKLTFTLSYNHFLSLLMHLSQTSFSLTSLKVFPIKPYLLSIQIHLIKLDDNLSQQDSIS